MAGARIFQRQRAGETVAELGGIGPEVLTRCAGVTRYAHVVVAVAGAVGDEGEGRLGPAHGEARELQEHAIPERGEGCTPAGVGRGLVRLAEAYVGAQRAVFSLLAYVPRDRRADAVVDVVGGVTGKSRLRRHAAGVEAG